MGCHHNITPPFNLEFCHKNNKNNNSFPSVNSIIKKPHKFTSLGNSLIGPNKFTQISEADLYNVPEPNVCNFNWLTTA